MARDQGPQARRASAGPARWAGALAVARPPREGNMYMAAIKHCRSWVRCAVPRPGAGTASQPTVATGVKRTHMFYRPAGTYEKRPRAWTAAFRLRCALRPTG